MHHFWVALVGSEVLGWATASAAAEVLAPFPIAVEDFPYVAVRRYTHRHRAAVLQCCPSGRDTSDLRACLTAAAESVTLSAAVAGLGVAVDTASPSESTNNTGSDAHDSSALAVLMMTSAELSGSYGAFAEATTAAWATSYRAPPPASSSPEELHGAASITAPVNDTVLRPTDVTTSVASPPCPPLGKAKGEWWARLDFLAVEIDDAAASGATYGSASASGGHAAQLAGGRAPHWQKVVTMRNTRT
jgi:hypothetical protein